MTELDIIKELACWLDEQRHPFQLSNCFIYMWECDYWCMTANGETREFEIKISRQDFKNDAKKHKHKTCNGANFFYYVCPANLIRPGEIDKRYGLIYVSNRLGLEIIRRPTRLNNNKFDRWQDLASKMYWKWRGLWKQKFIDKEITYSEYRAGFNFEI